MSGKPRASGNGNAPRTGGKSKAKYAPADTSEVGMSSVPAAASSSSSSSGAATGGAKGKTKLNEVQSKIDDVKAVMQENVDKAIIRGTQLDEVEKKSDTLLVDSEKFKESAAATKRMFCVRHWRNVAIIATVVIVFLIIIIWWATK